MDFDIYLQVRPFCGGLGISGKNKGKYVAGECYGTVATAFSHPEQYPLIKSITTDGTGTGTLLFENTVKRNADGTAASNAGK